MSRLNDLKREHNEKLKAGQDLYSEIQVLAEAVLALQSEIQEIEKDKYNPIPVLFGAGFNIEDYDE